ncbi:MAG: hypothetical protein MMC23_006585 [Stictis urceolatum]|nr:hypothetical protein [Stictis urceolata]
MPRAPASLVGRITSAGVTQKSATVLTTFQKFDRYLQRHYTLRRKLHISDPTSSLHTNDVVRFIYHPYLSRSKNIAHTVTEILAPWGPRLHERPPLLTAEERAARRALQVYKRGGKSAEGLRRGELVVDEGGRLRRVGEGEGWRRFGGVLGEGERGMVGRGEGGGREREDVAWFVDKEGRRRRIQSEVMKRTERMRREAEGVMGEAVEVGEQAEREGVDVGKRLEGMRISGGEVAAQGE